MGADNQDSLEKAKWETKKNNCKRRLERIQRPTNERWSKPSRLTDFEKGIPTEEKIELSLRKVKETPREK